jgi:hypothetical protein
VLGFLVRQEEPDALSGGVISRLYHDSYIRYNCGFRSHPDFKKSQRRSACVVLPSVQPTESPDHAPSQALKRFT